MRHFGELLGKTLAKVEVVGNEELILALESGEEFKFFHENVCCEHVTIEDISGDLADLVGSPLTMAEAVTSQTHPADKVDRGDDSFTWTFYRFATVKGYVTVRWYGSSTGEYSEEVEFARKTAKGTWQVLY